MKLFIGLVLSGCVGQPAPDVEVCRDFVHRLCIPAVCPEVSSLVPAGKSCELKLLETTGCALETFAFKSPTRDRFLSCRMALLKAGENSEQHPDCADVSASFAQCPEVVRMLQGIQ